MGQDKRSELTNLYNSHYSFFNRLTEINLNGDLDILLTLIKDYSRLLVNSRGSLNTIDESDENVQNYIGLLTRNINVLEEILEKIERNEIAINDLLIIIHQNIFNNPIVNEFFEGGGELNHLKETYIESLNLIIRKNNISGIEFF